MDALKIENLDSKEKKWVVRHSTVSNLMTQSDPLLYLLIAKWRLGPVWAYVIFSLVPLTSESIFCFFRGCLITTSKFIGMWNDYLNFSNFILFFPVIFTLYVWLPTGIEDIFGALKLNEIIPLTKKNRQALIRFDNYKERLLKDKFWVFMTIFLVVVDDALLIFPGTNKFVVWWNYYTFTFFSHQIVIAVMLYAAIFSIIRISQFILLLRFFFNEVKIDIKPLHPDGCGGLRPLGGFSVNLGYVLGALDTSVILTVYFQSYLLGGNLGDFVWPPAIVLFISVYSVCAPVVFFAPIGTAHKAMREAKERELLVISKQFELDYENMMKSLPSKTNIVITAIGNIEQLKRLYRIVQDFPVWPFNIQNLVRFVVSVLGPFILSIFPTILSLVLK